MVLNGNHSSNLLALVTRFPRILDVADILNKHNVRYGMFCSGTVETITAYRKASDVDLLIDPDDIELVEHLIDDAIVEYRSDRIQIGLRNTDYIDFFGQSTYYEKYPFFFTGLVWENSYLIPVKYTEIRMLHPLETILVKAIQQRGKEVGKHDWEDARQLSQASVCYDVEYTSRRIVEINADKRVFDFLRTISLEVNNQSELVDQSVSKGFAGYQESLLFNQLA